MCKIHHEIHGFHVSNMKTTMTVRDNLFHFSKWISSFLRNCVTVVKQKFGFIKLVDKG